MDTAIRVRCHENGSKQAITVEQRAALRAWYQLQYPRPSQNARIEWFFDKYNHRISQSTVSESLSKQYVNLDAGNLDALSSRNWTGQWPELEKVLYEWQKRIEKKGLFTSGELIIARARQIWHQLSESLDQPIPSFSIGWLANFKKEIISSNEYSMAKLDQSTRRLQKGRW